MFDTPNVVPAGQNAVIPLTRALRTCALACVLGFLAVLWVLGVSLVPVALAVVIGTVLWLAFRYPMVCLGAVLVFMPVYTLAFLLAKFFGPPYVGWLQGCDRAAVALPTFILWRRNGIKLTTPDWFLLACLGFALLRLAFGGSLMSLLTDFSFVIAYAAGRVTVLNEKQEHVWVKRAVWVVAVLAVLGMAEIFVIGEGPRTLLYLSVAETGTQGQSLDAAFHADQYLGMRESSTMFGPLQFAPLCMSALILWWAYFRNPVPGAMIAAGLICSLTRSAWLGTAMAICVLAFLMKQTRRLLVYAALALALFLAAIPILGLSGYLFSTKTGQDPSAQGHRESIFEGVLYISNHPLGIGPGNAGKDAVKTDFAAAGFENSYLTLSAEYGIPVLVCFLGFLISVLHVLRRGRTLPAFVAIAIVAGFGVVMMFAPLHDFFPLACWLWFPVGLAIRSATEDHGRESALVAVGAE